MKVRNEMARGYIDSRSKDGSIHVQMRDIKTVNDFRAYCKAIDMNSSVAVEKMVRYYLDNAISKYDYMSREELIEELKRREV